MREMHGTERSGPRPAKVRDAYTLKRKAGTRSLESGVRRLESLRICLDLAETCFNLPETCLDFFVMFTEQWSGPTNLPPRLAQLIRRPEMSEGAGLRVGYFDKEIPGAQLLLFRQLGHGKNRRETDPLFL